MPSPIRVVHYLNQVYAGIGRDEKADLPIEVRDRPIGPARLLNFLLGDQGDVVATIICGDGYFSDRRDEVLAWIDNRLALIRPEVVVAGPAYDLELYGHACGDVCLAAQRNGIPSITAMTPGQPGGCHDASRAEHSPNWPSTRRHDGHNFSVTSRSPSTLGPSIESRYNRQRVRRGWKPGSVSAWIFRGPSGKAAKLGR